MDEKKIDARRQVGNHRRIAEQRLKRNIKAFETAFATGDDDKFKATLRQLVEEDCLGAVTYVHRNQILMKPHEPARRQHVAEAYLDALNEFCASPEIIARELEYASYSEVVSVLRDDIHLHAANDAQIIAQFDMRTSVDLCCGGLVRIARRSLSEMIARFDQWKDGETSLTAARKAADLMFNYGGVYQLLPLMLAAVMQAHSKREDRRTVSLWDAARAADRLGRTAMRWATISDIRQRVALGFDAVSSVEPGPIIKLEPTRARRTCQRLVADRRLAMFGIIRRSRDTLPAFFKKIVEPIARFVSHVVSKSVRSISSDDITAHMLDQIAKSMLFVDYVVIGSMNEEKSVSHLSRSLWSIYFIINAFRLAYTYSRMNEASMTRGRRSYVVGVDSSDFIELVCVSAGVNQTSAREAIGQVTWRPGRVVPDDLGTRPLMVLADKQIAFVVLPGELTNPFGETRRVLSAGNLSSKYTGTKFEDYVRYLFKALGVHVHPTSWKLKSNEGSPITDVDVVGHKDGILFVVQTKYMAEPDSHYGIWKEQQEVESAIRQCVLARRFIESNTHALVNIFPDLAPPITICSVVVVSAIRYCMDGTANVCILDDTYIEHLAHVRVSQVFDGDNLIPDKPLYEEGGPSGARLRELLTIPAFRNSLEGKRLALQERNIWLSNVLVKRFDAFDE